MNAKVTNDDIINRLETKIKDYERRVEMLQNKHYAEMETHNKKEIEFKKYEELVSSSKWMMEREIRKELQGCTQKVIGKIETEEDKKILMEWVRELEKAVLHIIEQKMA